jgi:hypothetical protein
MCIRDRLVKEAFREFLWQEGIGVN